jgi:hypothetical protein
MKDRAGWFCDGLRSTRRQPEADIALRQQGRKLPVRFGVAANEDAEPRVTFEIERIRKYLVGHKASLGRPHHFFEHSSNGFLMTGYEDGSDWLVSPLGRSTWGKIVRDRPATGWTIGADRRDYHPPHLYILDLPAKFCAEISGLSLKRDCPQSCRIESGDQGAISAKPSAARVELFRSQDQEVHDRSWGN